MARAKDSYYNSLHIVCHDGVMSDSNSFTVRDEIRSVSNSQECHTDSAIMLDYREVVSFTTGLGLVPVEGWINLAVIPAQGDNILMSDTISFNISEEHVQFRFLQLVHGGDGCNCWSDQQLWVTHHKNNVDTQLNLTDMILLDNVCTRINNEVAPSTSTIIYCGGEVNETRGLITRVVYSDGSSDSARDMYNCPGDSNTLFPEYTITTTMVTTTEDITTEDTTTEETTTEDTMHH